MSPLIKAWYKPKFSWSWLLLPLSSIFYAVVALRRLAYRLKIFSHTKFLVPVIVIGNINVGGSGKTPLVIWLARYLQQQGYRPGIVSRGYKAQTTQFPLMVSLVNSVKSVGDEAYLIVQNTSCPMAIAPKRGDAIRCLLKNSNCNIVLCDDGLQHYALARDIEIAVLDGERRLGNRFCLPAGPLREPPNRLSKVDFIVVKDGKAQQNEWQMRLVPKELRKVNDSSQVMQFDQLKHVKVHALTGIGQPPAFFHSLRELQIDFIPHCYPDHHDFVKADIEFADQHLVLMTEKDAVKCRDIADDRHWYLAVDIIVDPTFGEKILQRLIMLQ